MSRATYFVDVILPLAVPNLYTYRVPFDLNNQIEKGKRVIVQLGKAKLYSALVRNIHEQPPKNYEAKYIESILDDKPIVNELQFVFWEWLSQYYMCQIGEVMLAALPGGLRLSSETKIILNTDFELNNINNALSDKEYLILDALEIKNVLTLTDVAEIVENKSVYSIVKSMIEKGIVLIQEELKEKFKPKLQTFVKLTAEYDKEENLQKAFELIEKKAPKQLEALMALIKLTDRYGKKKEIIKKSEVVKLVPQCDDTLKYLAKKNIIELFKAEVGRIEEREKSSSLAALNPLQQTVFDSIHLQFGINNKQSNENKDVVLLHGVTSSGKTEIYVKLIEENLKQGKQVLYLLPEIALTTQIINRLTKYFGNNVGVYHSRFNENERVEIWKKLAASSGGGDAQIIIGARSAMFLPFSNLGLIIVDEEHDTSFKQYDPSPRYNARDAAIYLAHIHNAKTLLGSATPSLESYYNALSGKYGFVELMERFGGVQMPEILIADVKEASKKRLMKSHFSPLLIENIEASLKQKEQIILFQNRRGFAPQIECTACAWVPECVNCDVSLTYHKHINQLRCHYCGYSIKPPDRCGACGDASLKMKGFGTEKIEDELSIIFPEIKIARMDLDTTRSKFAYQHIIHDFEERKIDILVGTQMVTKGLDFDNVGLVGILNADSMLNFPDFRSYERSYQLMAQVSGRAGRKNKRGKVIIQTYNPQHPIVQDVIANNYLNMYTQQMLDRKNFDYPPYFRLIEITVVHKDVNLVNMASKYIAEELKMHFKKRVLGPEFPIVSRIRNLFHKNILLKIERENSTATAKKIISELLIAFRNKSEFKTIRIKINVDPI